MDIDELEARVSRIINETGIGLNKGAAYNQRPDVEARAEQFEALEQELRNAVRESETPSRVQGALNVLLSFRDSLIGSRTDIVGPSDYQ